MSSRFDMTFKILLFDNNELSYRIYIPSVMDVNKFYVKVFLGSNITKPVHNNNNYSSLFKNNNILSQF